jgi:hypothetical protein
MTDPSIPGRWNGFSPPYSKSQIAAWVALLLVVLQFLVILSPVLPTAASIPVTLLFVALTGVVVYYAVATQAMDPSDVFLRRRVQDRAPHTRLYTYVNPPRPIDDVSTNISTVVMKQCWLCDLQVAERSMHCKFCNKCVEEFDHHCMCTCKKNTA